MDKNSKIKKLTNFKWLNMFKVNYKGRDGRSVDWFFASRKENPKKGKGRADAIVIVPFMDDKIVLIKQFRPSIGEYIIECPAGILEDREEIGDAAQRELKEETGLDIVNSKIYDIPLYNSIGISDDSVSYVFAEVKGEPTTKWNEVTEYIEILIVDKEEASSLLSSQQNISAKTWLILMAFVNGFDWKIMIK